MVGHNEGNMKSNENEMKAGIVAVAMLLALSTGGRAQETANPPLRMKTGIGETTSELQ